MQPPSLPPCSQTDIFNAWITQANSPCQSNRQHLAENWQELQNSESRKTTADLGKDL